MARYDVTTAVELQKRLYPEGLEKLLYELSPTFAMLPKWKAFTGEGKFLTWQFGSGGGASASFARAQANKSAGAYKRPFMTRKKEYALVSLDHEFLEACADDKGAIAEAYKASMDDAIYNVSMSLSRSIMGNGSGNRARIATTSTVNTATVTLATPSDARHFHVGMVVTAASTNVARGGAANTARTGGTARATITAVDVDAGTLTTSGNWNALITDIAAGDYLQRDGDLDSVITGFGAWLPATAPGGTDSFFTINRSVNPTLLAGIRYAPTSGSYDEVLIEAVQRGVMYGAQFDVCVLHPLDWAILARTMQSARRVEAKSEDGKVSFDAIELLGGAAKATKVISDAFCPQGTSYMLQTNTWEFWSLKEMPRLLTTGSSEKGLLRESDADASELRVGGYGELVCKNPSKNMVITLPTA